MELLTILNRCHRFRGFVYDRARFSSDRKSIEVSVRSRKGSAAICSRCHQPARPATTSSTSGALNSSLSGDFSSSSCTPCGEWVAAAAARVVEEVPWGDGKRTLTKVYMLFLAAGRAAFRGKKLLRSFRTSWEKVFDNRAQVSF